MAGDPGLARLAFAAALGWGRRVQDTAPLVSFAPRLNRLLDHAVGNFNRDVEAVTPLRQLQETLWTPRAVAGDRLALGSEGQMARGPARSAPVGPRLAGGALPSLTRCARSTDRHRPGADANRWRSRHRGPAEKVVKMWPATT